MEMDKNTSPEEQKSVIPEVLIIEDEPSLRSLFSDLLGSWGFTCRLAENGVEGIRLMEEHPSPIILTDLNMPSMDGLEVLRRSKKNWPDTEVILITGFGTMENAVIAMKKGAADFITKPVNFEHLRVVISKCMTQILSLNENKKLREANIELEKINQIKDRFINITNHELRTPLTIIQGYLDILDFPEGLNEDTKEGLTVIRKTIKDMTQILSHMHSLSVFDGSLVGREYDKIEIESFFSGIEKEFRPLFQKRKVNLQLENKSDLFSFESDYYLLKRAMRELIYNALKYTEEEKKVTVSIVSAEARKLLLSVSDEGIGIPLEEQKYVFDRFYEVKDPQHHFTSNDDFMGGGLGIGLSIVKEIVDNLKGSIFLDSKPDEGSKFTIVLPQ